MTDMADFDAEFARIREYNNASITAEELNKKSNEFRDAYIKLSRKQRNDRYREKNREEINEKRRIAYKVAKEKKALANTSSN